MPKNCTFPRINNHSYMFRLLFTVYMSVYILSVKEYEPSKLSCKPDPKLNRLSLPTPFNVFLFSMYKTHTELRVLFGVGLSFVTENKERTNFLIYTSTQNKTGKFTYNVKLRCLCGDDGVERTGKYYIFWVCVCTYSAFRAHAPYYIVICSPFGSNIILCII